VTVAATTVPGSSLVAYDQPLTLTATGGTLTAVTVTGPRGAVTGALTPAGWTSTTPLLPGSTYAAVTSWRGTDGRTGHQQLSVHTTAAAHQLTGVLIPGDGEVVGVGEPVAVRFSAAVPESARDAVVAGLSVHSSPAVTGAWRWMSPSEVHWRPQEYWPAQTKVHATLDLRGIQIGPTTWGSGRHTTDFTIGARHVSVADATKHTLVVTADGATVKTFPMSAGSPKYPSRSGVHLALEKSPVVTMDSATVGIPRNSPDGYYEKVAWDVRISYGGAFVHAAPWSTASQGSSNVSHGCINLSTDNARWFYGFTQRGDIVEVTGTNVPPLLSDPGTSDWNLTWAQWVSS
jgi:lipoprotein-anchoring transpeptidase ErfK/SrfK